MHISIKKWLLSLMAFNLLVIQGCNKFVSEDDVNPNQPREATPTTLLPVIEVSVFATYTGAVARNTSMFIQHSTGISNQSLDYARYNITEVDIQNDWTTIYNAGVVNTNILINQTEGKSPYYAGITKILKASLLGIATDLWGDIPARQAGLGFSDLTPTYDTQETVLQDVQQLLSDGIADLQQPVSANTQLPGGDDYIHGGDPARWIKTAWILKARYANRLSKRDPVGSATTALGFLDQAGLTGNEDDAVATFSSNNNSLNQWYAFYFTRANYMKMSATLIDRLKSTNDPRLPVYASPDVNGEYSGAPVGSQDADASDIGPYYGSADSPLPLVTYTEAKFIEAEAALRAGNAQRAQDAYAAAVEAALTRYGNAIDATAAQTYIAANNTLNGSDAEKLNAIMTQKWIAMFTQPEAWMDWRRTGLPQLQPNPEGFTQPLQIPRRYPTEQRERINNPNAVVVSNLTTPVWWDQQ